jgi:hypothetical protein
MLAAAADAAFGAKSQEIGALNTACRGEARPPGACTGQAGKHRN